MMWRKARSLLKILVVLNFVVQGIELIGTDGFSDCKCSRVIDLVRLAQDNATCSTPGVSLKAVFNGGATHCFPDSYGQMECQEWDKLTNPECATSSGVPLSNAPSWCADSWCYVSKSCPMKKSLTQYFPGAPELWYSYGTCGHADHFRDWTIATRLKEQPMRVYMLDEAEYGLAYPSRPADHPVGRGALIDVYEQIRSLAGFIYNFTPLLDYNADDSAWDSCVTNVALGNIDLCLGTFWETQERMANSSFVTPIGVDNFHMVVKKVEEESFGAQLTSVFKPFTWRLWIMICFFMTMISIVMWILEYRAAGEDHDDFPSQSHVPNMLRSQYLTCIGFWSGGPAHAPTTPSGKMVICSFAIFIMLALSGYTANLASFMVTEQAAGSINDLDDIMNGGLKLCLPKTVKLSFLEKYPRMEPFVRTVVSSKQGYIDMDSGLCDAALAGFDFHQQQLKRTGNCNKIMAEKVFFSAMLSQPVNVEYQRAMSYWMVKMRAESKLASSLLRYEPADECKNADKTDDDVFGVQFEGQMDIKDFTGTFTIVAIVLALGLIIRFCRVSMESEMGQQAVERAMTMRSNSGSLRSNNSSSPVKDQKLSSPAPPRTEDGPVNTPMAQFVNTDDHPLPGELLTAP